MQVKRTWRVPEIFTGDTGIMPVRWLNLKLLTAPCPMTPAYLR